MSLLNIYHKKWDNGLKIIKKNSKKMKPKLFKARGRIATDILGRSKYTTYTEA